MYLSLPTDRFQGTEAHADHKLNRSQCYAVRTTRDLIGHEELVENEVVDQEANQVEIKDAIPKVIIDDLPVHGA